MKQTHEITSWEAYLDAFREFQALPPGSKEARVLDRRMKRYEREHPIRNTHHGVKVWDGDKWVKAG
jgi:hypothetical protein